MNKALHESVDVSQSLKSLRALEDISLGMQNIETGCRGFLLTGENKFLEPFEKGIASIKTDTLSLIDNVDDFPNRASHTDQLLALVRLDISISDELIKDKKANKSEEFIYSKLSSEKGVMDSIRSLVSTMENEDRARLQISNAASKTQALRTTNLFVFLAITFIILLFIIFWFLGKSFKRRRDSEEEANYLASLVNQTFDAIFSTDESFVIKSWNKAAEKMYGFSKEEAIGKALDELIKPIVTEEKRILNYKNLAEDLHHTDEFHVYKKDGTRFPIWASVTSLLDENGKTSGYILVHKDISERKKLEEQLLRFTEKLEIEVKEKTKEITEVFDRVSDAFFALDKKWFFTYANRKAEELFNFPIGHFINRKMQELFPESVNTPFYQAGLKALEKQEMQYMEVYSTKFLIWLEVHIYPSDNGLSIYLRNITERKKAETDLFLAHQRLTRHIDNTPLAIVEWDANMLINRWSRRAEEIFGWTSKEMMGKDISKMKFVFDEDAGTVGDIINSLMRGDKSVNRSFNRNYTKSGEVIHCEWFASILKNENDEIIALLALVQDITPRIKASEAIERANERFRLIATTTNDAIWEWNLGNNEAWGNEVHQQLYGLTLADPVPDFKSWESRIHPDERADIVKNMDEAVANPTKNSIFCEYRFLTQNEGYKCIYDRTYIVRDTEGKAVRMMGNMMDISESKKMQDQIKNTSNQLRQLAGRLQEVREEERLNISREIHDELGQQLSVLKMDVSWLGKKMKNESSETRDKIEETLSLLDSTIKTVRRIASNLRPGLLDDLGLVAALEWHSKEIQNRSGIKIEFLTNAPEMELPSATATALFRIYQESLTNVVRHAAARSIIAELILENNFVTLTISDDGQGFDTNKMETTGTLGILGMKERTLKLKGEYFIKSILGKGTMVKVIVPLESYPEPNNIPL